LVLLDVLMDRQICVTSNLLRMQTIQEVDYCRAVLDGTTCERTRYTVIGSIPLKLHSSTSDRIQGYMNKGWELGRGKKGAQLLACLHKYYDLYITQTLPILRDPSRCRSRNMITYPKPNPISQRKWNFLNMSRNKYKNIQCLPDCLAPISFCNNPDTGPSGQERHMHHTACS
jgi:hypothetical protein